MAHLPVKAREIIQAVAFEVGIPVAEIIGGERRPDLTEARYEMIRRLSALKSESGKRLYSQHRIGEFMKLDRSMVSYVLFLRERRLSKGPQGKVLKERKNGVAVPNV